MSTHIKRKKSTLDACFIEMMPWIFKRDSDSSRIMKHYHHTWEEKESQNLLLCGFNHNSFILRTSTDESSTLSNTD